MWWDVPSRLVLELSACSVLGWKSPIHVGAFIVETEHHPNSRTLSPPLHWQWLKDCLLWSDALVLRVTSWHVRCTRWRKPTRMPTFSGLVWPGPGIHKTLWQTPWGSHSNLQCASDWLNLFHSIHKPDVRCWFIAAETFCEIAQDWLWKNSRVRVASGGAHDCKKLHQTVSQKGRPMTSHYYDSEQDKPFGTTLVSNFHRRQNIIQRAQKTTVTAEEKVARLFCWFCPRTAPSWNILSIDMHWLKMI